MEDLLARLGAPSLDLGVALVAALAIYAWVIAATRVAGLRSFAKMSAFDFSMTVAIGSIIATTAVGGTALSTGLLATTVLYVAQVVVSRLRRATGFEQVVDNTPLLLMDGPEAIEDHLARARLTHGDLRATLRAANVADPSQIRAVVLETTGDVSVVRGDQPVDAWLLEDVDCGTADHRAP